MFSTINLIKRHNDSMSYVRSLSIRIVKAVK